MLVLRFRFYEFVNLKYVCGFRCCNLCYSLNYNVVCGASDFKICMLELCFLDFVFGIFASGDRASLGRGQGPNGA